jgi:hypothetical protein
MATKKKAKKAVDRKKTAKKPEPPVVQTAYRVGDFVRLPRFEDNPEAYGQIQHVEQGNGMYIVKLNEKYSDGEHDDLLREVSANQMEYCLHPKALILKESFRSLLTYKCPDCERIWDIDTSG